MALSTRAKLAGLGGALALGVLGAGGVAYAAGDDTGAPRYVTTVDDGAATYGQQAPADGERPAGKDCPEGAGGQRGDQSGGQSGQSAAPTNPADA